MPASAAEITDHLDTLLGVEDFEDYGPNGLQVPAGAEVEVVATGVSAHLELFERAREEAAQLVLCHHGILWDFHPRRIDERLARRLRFLFDAGLGLAMYHLPLDAHPDHGNNALLAEGLGCERRAPFGHHRGRAIGVAAHFPGEGIPAAELFARVESLTGQAPLVFDAGPELVRSIGIVSGAAAASIREAADRGLDAFLTGEPAEHVMAEARESAVHFIAGGHYGTETLGIRRLGDLVAERFGLRHVFIDVPNPV
jgi:dinuclear metal center YbgI/SA1388 family protein